MTETGSQPLKIHRLPLTVQAQQHILQLIQNGTYRPGDQLPSQDDLATQLGISRPTLREALLNLEQEGIILRKHGVGTFVTPWYGNRLEGGLERLESILEMASRQGMQLRFGDLEVETLFADPELAQALQVMEGTPLTSVRRVFLVGEVPVAFMIDVAPSAVLSASDIDATFCGSVLECLRQKRELAYAVANIMAIDADAYLSGRLCVEPGQALLLLEETLYDQAGEVVDFSRNFFHPEHFRFHVVRR